MLEKSTGLNILSRGVAANPKNRHRDMLADQRSDRLPGIRNRPDLSQGNIILEAT